MKLIRRILEIFNSKKQLKSADGINIDLGASTIKYCINNNMDSFISSVREVHDKAEIMDQENVLKINNKWYIIGETHTSPSSEVRKCKKPNIDIMVVYSLIKEKLNSGAYDINMLLPYNQLKDEEELRKRINGTYEIETALKEKYVYDINVKNVKCEGLASYYYVKTIQDIKTPYAVMINVGFSTTDIAVFKGNVREKTKTIMTGTNIILDEYINQLDAPSTSVLSARLAAGDTFTKEEEKENLKSIETCINNLAENIKNVLRYVPRKSKIVICGGGSIGFGHLIKQKIGLENIVVLKDNEAVFTDVLGLGLFCNSYDRLKMTEKNNSRKKIAESIESIAVKGIAQNNDRKNISENRKEELTERSSIKIITEEIAEQMTEDLAEKNNVKNIAESNDIKVLRFPEKETSNLYDIVVKKLRQVEAEKRISPKNLDLDLSEYEWRKIKNQLLEDDLIVVKGTNTYKKEITDHEVRA